MHTIDFAPGDAGHGPARGYRSMLDTLRNYWREKDGEMGRAASRDSSGGRRAANRRRSRK